MPKSLARYFVVLILLVAGGPCWTACASAYVDVQALLSQAEDSRVKDPAKTQALLLELANNLDKANEDELIRYQLLQAHQQILKGQYDLAETSLNQTLSATENPNRKMRALYLLAQLEGIRGKIDSSFEYILQASELYPKLTETQAKVDYFFIMTYMYSRVEDFDTALANAEKLVALVEEKGSPYQRCIAQQSLTTIYHLKGDLEQGLAAAQKQLAVCSKSAGPIYVASANLVIGHYYLKKNDATDALGYFLKAKNGFDDAGYKDGQLNTSVGIAKSFYALGNKALAYSWASRGLDMLGGSQWKEKSDLYLLMAKINAADKDKELVDYTEKYASAVESLANESKNTRLSYLQAKLRFDSQKQQISLLEQQNQLLTLQDDNAHQRFWLLVQGLLGLVLFCALLMVLLFRNRHQQKRLKALSERDELTLFYNRTTFFKKCDALFAEGRPLTLVVVGVDNFYRFNLQYGVQTSDRVIHRVAQRFASAVGSEFLLGRIGAAEFVAVMEDVPIEVAKERVRACQRPGLRGEDVNLDLLYALSFGIAQQNQDDSTFESLLQRTQKAMCLARENGKNSVEVATEKENSV